MKYLKNKKVLLALATLALAVAAAAGVEVPEWVTHSLPVLIGGQ